MTPLPDAPTDRGTTSLPGPSVRVHLVRHGDAVGRRTWAGTDERRPLTAVGARQAEGLARRLCAGESVTGARPFPAGRATARQLVRVVTSPASRCSETLRATALAAGLELEEVGELGEGSDPLAALGFLLAAASGLDAGQALAACSHGDVVYGVLDALAATGLALDGPRAVPKASTWELDVVDGTVRAARFVGPPIESFPGPLALLGGGEWRDGASVDTGLLAEAGGEVVVLPTAAAYEHPERCVATAERWFAALGGRVRPCMVLTRSDASDPGLAAVVREARFVYLAGGSPLHARSVLKDSTVLQALRHAWSAGAVVAGSSAGAMVLTDPMVDPRGGALTVGLGLVRDVAVVPHFTGEITAQLRRTLALAPSGCAVAALPESTALVREPDGLWRTDGPGRVAVFVSGEAVGLEVLAGRPVD